MRLCAEFSTGVAVLLIFYRAINRKDADTEEDLGKDGISTLNRIMFDCLYHKAKWKKNFVTEKCAFYYTLCN
jgi:hypothetical protein